MEYTIDKGYLFIEGIEFVLETHEFIEKVGNGANAEVFSAKNKLLNRKEAVKIWVPRKGFLEVDYDRFKNEISKNAVFKDENIVHIYSGGTNCDKYYAIMEFVDGKTLDEVLQMNTQFLYRSILFDKIVKTLGRVYEKGIYHGDLHSKNILVTEDYDIKIIDFGTSIFAKNIETSHQRDAKLLLKLSQQILPQYKELDFFDDNVFLFPSIYILEALYYIKPIIEELEVNPLCEWDSFRLRNILSGTLRNIILDFPIFDLVKIEGFFDKNKINKIYIGSIYSLLNNYFEGKGHEFEIVSFDLNKLNIIEKYNDYKKRFLSHTGE